MYCGLAGALALQRSRLRLHRHTDVPSSQVRLALPAFIGAARSRGRGSRALPSFPLCVNGPLDELTCVHSRRCALVFRTGQIDTPATRHARCRAAGLLGCKLSCKYAWLQEVSFFAKINRVERVMQPYLEAVVAWVPISGLPASILEKLACVGASNVASPDPVPLPKPGSPQAVAWLPS